MKLIRLYFIAFILFCEGCIMPKGQVTGHKIKSFDLASNSRLVFDASGNESYYYEIVNRDKGSEAFDVLLKNNYFKVSSGDTLRVGPFFIQDVKFYNKGISAVQFTIIVELNKQQFEFPKHRIYALD